MYKIEFKSIQLNSNIHFNCAVPGCKFDYFSLAIAIGRRTELNTFVNQKNLCKHGYQQKQLEKDE